jgi:hypothetical protein
MIKKLLQKTQKTPTKKKKVLALFFILLLIIGAGSVYTYYLYQQNASEAGANTAIPQAEGDPVYFSEMNDGDTYPCFVQGCIMRPVVFDIDENYFDRNQKNVFVKLMSGSYADAVEITEYQVHWNSSRPFIIEWQDPNPVQGSYSIFLRAEGDDGTSADSEILNVEFANTILSVMITEPSDQSEHDLGDSITLTAQAGGDVDKVEFFEGGSKIAGSVTNNGEFYSLDWSPASAGTYPITAKVTDVDGDVEESDPVELIISESQTNQPPTISITSPTETNYTTLDPVTLVATADDADGTVENVEFFVDGNKIEETVSNNNNEYSLDWTPTSFNSFSITAKATDDDGETVESSALNLSFSESQTNQPPTISITSPTETNYTTLDPVTLVATADDADGNVETVEFFVGEEKIEGTVNNSGSEYTIEWTPTIFADYTITAKATDDGGETTTSQGLTLSFNEPENIPPTVSITPPTQEYQSPADVPLEATAEDSDGTIDSVTFLNGSQNIGSGTLNTETGKYELNWKSVPAGSFTVIAKATDDRGAVTASESINVIVNGEGGNRPPSVSIIEPTDSIFEAPAQIRFVVQAGDDSQVSSVELYEGNQPLGNATLTQDGNYELIWEDVPQGTYEISAKATDDQGSEATSSILNLIVQPGSGGGGDDNDDDNDPNNNNNSNNNSGNDSGTYNPNEFNDYTSGNNNSGSTDNYSSSGSSSSSPYSSRDLARSGGEKVAVLFTSLVLITTFSGIGIYYWKKKQKFKVGDKSV